MASTAKVFPLTSVMVTGSIIHAVAAAISVVSILLLAGLLGYAQYKNPNTNVVLQQLGLNFLGLLLADIFLGISGLMQLYWLHHGQIFEGPMCTAQGILYQLGSFGGAVFSFSVTTHAFTVLVRGEPASRRLGIAALLGGGIATLLINTTLPFILERTLGNGNFFGVGDQTCGISTAYPLPHILMHCSPIIFSVLFMFLYLLLRGKVWGRRAPSSFVSIAGRTNRQIIWFPTVYAILAIPTVVVHALTVFSHTVPSIGWSTTATLFSLLGTAHALFFLTAREKLIFATAPKPRDVEKGTTSQETTVGSKPVDSKLLNVHERKDSSTPLLTRQRSPQEWKPPSIRSTARSTMYEQAKSAKVGPREEIDTSWLTAPVEVCPIEASQAAIPQSPLIPGTPVSGTTDQIDPDLERVSIVSRVSTAKSTASLTGAPKLGVTRAQPGFV